MRYAELRQALVGHYRTELGRCSQTWIDGFLRRPKSDTFFETAAREFVTNPRPDSGAGPELANALLGIPSDERSTFYVDCLRQALAEHDAAPE